MTRPEASETTGTLRETSGMTVPVTINSESAERSVAAASGNCAGWSTVNRAGSAPGTTLGAGGAPAAALSSACACTLLQLVSVRTEEIEIRSRIIPGPLCFTGWFICVLFRLRATFQERHKYRVRTTSSFLIGTDKLS